MINKFPTWKNTTVVVALLIAVVYSLPNLFGSDFAVQISKLGGTDITANQITKVISLLDKNSINYKSVTNNKDSILIRFTDTVIQLKAQSILKEELGRGFSIALKFSTISAILAQLFKR